MLAAAAIVGLNLMVVRYASVVLVPAVLLAASNLAELSGADLIAPLTPYVVITTVAFLANARVCGSLSGAGCQDWRDAVAAVDAARAGDESAPVLYRSGNAEDDRSPGHVEWPATLAPLRSPGRPPVSWPVIMLTYRWASTERAEYFAESLRPALAGRTVFFMLCLRSDEPGSGGYCGTTEQWIAATWPGLRVTRLGDFRQITALKFERIGA